MRVVAFLIFISILFIKCSSETEVPSSVIPPEKMKLIVFDLLRADELINTRIADTSFRREEETQKYYEEIFLIHHTDRRAFYESYKYYQAHPDVNKVLFDSLSSYAGRQRIIATPGKS